MNIDFVKTSKTNNVKQVLNIVFTKISMIHHREFIAPFGRGGHVRHVSSRVSSKQDNDISHIRVKKRNIVW